MLQLERYQLILQMLEQQGAMRVNDIAQLSNVSRETARRDLTEMERRGLIHRSHGGALLARQATPSHCPTTSVLPVMQKDKAFHQRTLQNTVAKTRIARQALSLIHAGDTIMLDNSSSSWFLARQLPDIELTVVTPSASIVQTLMSRPSLRLIGLGGEFSPHEEAFFGESTVRQLQEHNIHMLFFSCQGLERDSGLYAGSEVHAALLHQMIIHSRCVCLLADNSKFEQRGMTRFSGFGEIDYLITEPFDDPLMLKEMIWHNVNILTT